ncbi:hypothetical protein FB45DRAFT_882700 [Roridomyces roridus]|uniref:Uncharacterized protein n=1 Tax=Roridomyces roridus TaxID=1738132 RepID=A0AAD7F5P5_9AGAR|nr:hypothetical protein FB45DRAFT_882700 [Roridomyces roridus]
MVGSLVTKRKGNSAASSKIMTSPPRGSNSQPSDHRLALNICVKLQQVEESDLSRRDGDGSSSERAVHVVNGRITPIHITRDSDADQSCLFLLAHGVMVAQCRVKAVSPRDLRHPIYPDLQGIVVDWIQRFSLGNAHRPSRIPSSHEAKPLVWLSISHLLDAPAIRGRSLALSTSTSLSRRILSPSTSGRAREAREALPFSLTLKVPSSQFPNPFSAILSYKSSSSIYTRSAPGEIQVSYGIHHQGPETLPGLEHYGSWLWKSTFLKDDTGAPPSLHGRFTYESVMTEIEKDIGSAGIQLRAALRVPLPPAAVEELDFTPAFQSLARSSITADLMHAVLDIAKGIMVFDHPMLCFPALTPDPLLFKTDDPTAGFILDLDFPAEPSSITSRVPGLHRHEASTLRFAAYDRLTPHIAPPPSPLHPQQLRAFRR